MADKVHLPFLGGSDDSAAEATTLRGLCLSCKELLRKLTKSLDEAQAHRAREQLPRLNIWAANVGILESGRRSLEFKLEFMPDISILMRLLLQALERDLLKVADSRSQSPSGARACPSEVAPDASGDVSDDSSISYSPLSSEDEESTLADPITKIWLSIEGILGRLSRMAILIRQAGAEHRKARVQQFLTKDSYKTVYDTFERLAFEKASFLFPKASKELQERMAKSIAYRRARFSYLRRHKKKKDQIMTGRDPDAGEGPDPEQGDRPDISSPTADQPSSKDHGDVAGNAAAVDIFSVIDTDVTRLRPPPPVGRPPSVSSTLISLQGFPDPPKLRGSGDSFTCPYCCLDNPGSEAVESLWKQHVARDFEPYFCVWDGCTDPFGTGESYNGWISHMRENHTRRWQCWLCVTQGQEATLFWDSEDVRRHAEREHPKLQIEDLVKQSINPNPQIFRECPFCGGLPEDLERAYPDQDSRKAQQALEEHVRHHLITVALMLQPLDLDVDEGAAVLIDLDSDAQRDPASVGKVDDIPTNPAMSCDRASGEPPCDCKVSDKDSVRDWTVFGSAVAVLSLPEDLRPKSHDDPSYIPGLTSLTSEWDFWKPLSRDGRTETGPPKYKGHHTNMKLLEGFREKPGVERAIQELEGHPTSAPVSWDPNVSLEERINASLCVSTDRGRRFLPATRLARLITEDSVFQELNRVLSDQISPDGLRSYARSISSHFKRIFATLILIGKGETIGEFINEYHSDGDLPLVMRNQDKFLHQKAYPEVPLTLKNWSMMAIDNFEEMQWSLLAPVFLGTQTSIPVYRLHDATILPFIEDSRRELLPTEAVMGGGLPTSFRVKIHPDHHDFHDTEIHDDYFAIIALFPSRRGGVPYEILVFQKNRHLSQRWVSLLAGYRHRDQWFLIFPSPQANLLQFWERHSPLSPLGQELVLWVAAQCEGIAEGLERLHNSIAVQNIRSEVQLTDPTDLGKIEKTEISRADVAGPIDVSDETALFGWDEDIKPQIILWYTNPDVPSDRGTLKLDITALLTHTKRSIDSTKSYAYHTYMTPECVIGGAVIGRSADVWSLGCVYLDFLTWLLHGSTGIHNFGNLRMSEGPIGVMTDVYFEDSGTTTHGTPMEILKPSVVQWSQDLRQHESCTPFIRDFLDVIMQGMLVVDIKTRMPMSRVYAELRRIHYRCKEDIDYATKPYLARS